QLADEAIAAAPGAGPAGAAPDRQLTDAQRELGLERLDRRVQRVRHRHVDRARAVGVAAGTLAAAERLVIGEALARQRQVVHRPLTLGGDRAGAGEGGDDE